MSKPANGHARNYMSPFERKYYDLGWEAAEDAIIKLLVDSITDDEDQYRLGWAIALIKGENNE